MTSEDEIRKMFEWIENEPNLGRVDVCIPNAGLSVGKTLLDGTVQEWKQMMDVNVISLNLCTQLSIKSMLKVQLLHCVFSLMPNNFTDFFCLTERSR